MSKLVKSDNAGITKGQNTVDRGEVEKYLTKTINCFIKKINSKVNEDLGKKLVEQVNVELSSACPSTEGFRFVVQAVVQEQWGQGSLVGARCLWDNSRDLVVSVNKDTDKVSLTLSVFFVANEEDNSDTEEEAD